MNSKKYFPSDTEDDIDLEYDTQYDRPRLHENEGEPRTAGKENNHRPARPKIQGAGSSHQSDKMTAPQTRLRSRER